MFGEISLFEEQQKRAKKKRIKVVCRGETSPLVEVVSGRVSVRAGPSSIQHILPWIIDS